MARGPLLPRRLAKGNLTAHSERKLFNDFSKLRLPNPVIDSVTHSVFLITEST
jgi:hypothetical protein